MTPVSSTRTQNTARNVIAKANIIKINNFKFSSKVSGWCKHSTIVASKIIPTKIRGCQGAHGHTYISESATELKKRSGEDPNPPQIQEC
jgi:hypothetical protein